MPDWCNTDILREFWRKPWTVPRSGRHARKFKRRLRKHGHLSPNFTITEFGSKTDGCGCGFALPTLIQTLRLQHLAFKLERVRHNIGDHAIGVLSGLRSSCHNSCVGGASASEHMNGRAIDPIKPAAVSWDAFNDAMAREFQHGGIGRGCSTAHVMHVDTGSERRWCYPGS